MAFGGLQLQRLRYDMQLEWKQLRRREVALRERAQWCVATVHLRVPSRPAHRCHRAAVQL
jgi:hypothetical protein